MPNCDAELGRRLLDTLLALLDSPPASLAALSREVLRVIGRCWAAAAACRADDQAMACQPFPGQARATSARWASAWSIEPRWSQLHRSPKAQPPHRRIWQRLPLASRALYLRDSKEQ